MATDQRHTQRVDCRGLAGVQRLPAVEEPIAAKIENLSEGGCLMKLDAPAAIRVVLELDEKVELRFEVNQLPFRILARVRVLRSNTMIGFQFGDVSERAKRQLQDLIEELRVQ